MPWQKNICFRAEYVSPTAHGLVGYSKATWQEAIFLFIPKVFKLVKSQNLWYKRVSPTVQFLICKMLTHGHLDHKSTHIHVVAFCHGWKKKSLTGLSIRASRGGSFENEALENADRSMKHPKLKNKVPIENKALENEAPKNSKTKHPKTRKRSSQKLENEDP